jgi:glutaredoxin
MMEGHREPVPCITLYTKADCELCDAAKATLLGLQGELGFAFDEIDITTSPALYDAFHAEIPVGFLDGRKVFKYQVDSTLLRRQLRRRHRWLVDGWFCSRRS